MRKVNHHAALIQAAQKVTEDLRREQVHLTLGGEPTYVPIDPSAPEWSFTAVGPTKLGFAHEMTEALIRRRAPGSLAILSPGKFYPGEPNARWAVNILSNRDGTPLNPHPPARPARPSAKAVAKLRRFLTERLRLKSGTWMSAHEPDGVECGVCVLPLDVAKGKWVTQRWPFKGSIPLTAAEGPAGLRLPLGLLPETALKRALVLEPVERGLSLFLPPLLQEPFNKLLKTLLEGIGEAGISSFQIEGYVPSDESNQWIKLAIAPDPGVLEVNLPACNDWFEYESWIRDLDSAAAEVGLRPFKRPSEEEEFGSGGGNHLLFGGPSDEENAFFTNPSWVTSILRYWQHHPSLSYLFTGHYVGPSSQAPRPDESSRELYDLEMAYRFLESLGPGDHRYLISETLRHLHTDGSGNTHRSEISFDKFWSPGWPGGCRGLIEFRAIETLPRTEWTSAVALLWIALASRLYLKHYRRPLVDHGSTLHDCFFLPTPLWEDFRGVLRDLKRVGYNLPPEVFREIWNWRFPVMLRFESKGGRLVVRKAHEGWPLLCETPLEGGTTSRFVDTSIERLEFLADHAFTKSHRVYVQGRELKMGSLGGNHCGAGLRYRRSALHPSLHPGIEPHMPLILTVKSGRKAMHFRLAEARRQFEAIPADQAGRLGGRPCQKLDPSLLTCDLRLP